MTEKTVLLIASTASMIKQFNQRNIAMLKDINSKVIVATNFLEPGTIPNQEGLEFKKQLENNGIQTIQVDFARGLKNPFKNISAYRQLNRFVENQTIDLIHCQTPIGGVVGRLISHRNKIKNLYVVHGFHFFKGASIFNWLAYPIEKFLAKYTDYLVTINQEDYQLAKNKFKKAGQISKINSAGVDFLKMDRQVTATKSALRNQIRKNLDWDLQSNVMITVAELSKRKNLIRAIKAFSKSDNTNLNYLIVGKGPDEKKLSKLIERLDLSQKVKLIGYSDRVYDLLTASDLMIFISLREGLGLAGVEALHFDLPLIGANIRGIKDYLKNNQNGFLVNPKNIDEITQKINQLNDNQVRTELASHARSSVADFDSSLVDQKMLAIYQSLLK